MATYTLDQYQKVWRARARELKRASNRSASTAAMFMRNTARGFAPMKSGRLRQGIIATPLKDQEWQVSSGVSFSFPYHLWVNKTPPYKSPKMWWNGFHPTVYGDGTHRITGTPGYWTQAKIQTTRFFGNIARENVRKVFSGLNVRVT